MPMTKQAQDFFYTEDLDLTDDQIAETQRTYIFYAKSYVENYERKKGALENTKAATLDPFVNYYKKIKLSNPVLFIGCGSGRDMDYVNRQGISTYGIDISKPLLDIARESGIESPLEIMDVQAMDFEESSFDGIFCETALSHIKKTKLPIVLNKIYQTLRPGGIAIVGLRQGDGRVYFTKDLVGGLRFNTTITQDEIHKIISTIGFNILDTNISTHQITNRPPFYNLIIQKKK